jgi:hypothetical protein
MGNGSKPPRVVPSRATSSSYWPRPRVGVAFVVQGDRVVVYLCDGKKRSEWFGGPVASGRFDIATEESTRVVGRVADKDVTGTIARPGGLRLGFKATPPRDRPPTGLYVVDDPGKQGYKARWIVTENAVHGISTTTTGTTTNALRVTRTSTSTSSGSTTNSQIAALLATQQALAAELKAAQSEDVSLRDTLGSGGTSTTSTTK